MDNAKIKSFWMIILATIFVTAAQYLYKTGAGNLPTITYEIPLALVLMGVVTLLMVMALKKTELSYAYPLLATSFIWVGLIGVLLLGEFMSITNWIGLGMIFAGVVVLR